VQRRLGALAACLAIASIAVVVALVISIMGGLNGVIPERDAPALLRTLVLLLLLNTLVLAWTALLRRRRRV
jgi:ABC-type multidrug transport system permease subunit